MCLLCGGSVYGGELFERAVSDDFLLTEKACVCIARQICEGLAFIHSMNIIHLDMKVSATLIIAHWFSRRSSIHIFVIGLLRSKYIHKRPYLSLCLQ